MLKNFKSKHLVMILISILAILWGSVVVIGGTIGPFAWWGLMIVGVVGNIIAVITVIKIVIRVARKRPISKSSILLLLISMLAAWPAYWFLGIGQIAYPANAKTVSPSISIRSPFEKPVIVAWGGDALQDNYHAWLPCERWAYDIFATPAVLESQRLKDYGIYGVDVVAPISGTIVGTYDEEKDHGTGLEDFESVKGNYIVIQIEETGTYLLLAHLRYHSILVNEGDYVKEGARIAQAGNTGSSSEPHLHIHHQRQNPEKTFLLAEGLPLYFRDVEGSVMPKGGGDRMENGKRIPVGETIIPLS